MIRARTLDDVGVYEELATEVRDPICCFLDSAGDEGKGLPGDTGVEHKQNPLRRRSFGERVLPLFMWSWALIAL